jgi:hypothetical protein
MRRVLKYDEKAFGCAATVVLSSLMSIRDVSELSADTVRGHSAARPDENRLLNTAVS